jgi:hypothetical protein
LGLRVTNAGEESLQEATMDNEIQLISDGDGLAVIGGVRRRSKRSCALRASGRRRKRSIC